MSRAASPSTAGAVAFAPNQALQESSTHSVPPRLRHPGIGPLIIIAVVITVHVIAWRGTEISVSALVDGWHGFTDFLSSALPPDFSRDGVVKPGIVAALVTFHPGLLGTTLSIPDKGIRLIDCPKSRIQA